MLWSWISAKHSWIDDDNAEIRVLQMVFFLKNCLKKWINSNTVGAFLVNMTVMQQIRLEPVHEETIFYRMMHGHFIMLAAISLIFALFYKRKMLKILMLFEQMWLRSFCVGSAFWTTQRKTHKGLLLLFSLVLLSVLFCVLFHAWLTTISILFKTVMKILLIIIQIKSRNVENTIVYMINPS